ncbi:MAG TPA: hypothetical protein VJ953_19040 [Saprospiraceae bacterium]|nr:hypothetical protein [Saprospiraceae bacterium]
MRSLIFIFFILLLTACQSGQVDFFAAEWKAEEIPLDSEQSLTPNLFVGVDGQAYLSYLHHPNDSFASLQLRILEEGAWGAAQTIASGEDWFVNWADFPSVAAFRQKPTKLAAHWLQKRAAGTYDYDVRVSIASADKEWSPSFVPHRDSVAAEHGFVSLLPLPNGRMFASWLDGRFTKVRTSEAESSHQHGHGGGAMTLRAAEFDENGQLFAEAEIDHRVCDCCQTDAALGPEGPVVVYRDRSEEEIRDIYLARRVGGVWQIPQKIGKDNWTINGCPVNGPAIATLHNTLAVAWFTMANDTPRVQVVFSEDGGGSFGVPIRLDQQEAIGRVDIVLADERNALVSFLEDDGQNTRIKVVPVNTAGERGETVFEHPSDFSRRSGFPILEKQENGFLMAFTVVDEGNTRVKTMRISQEN